MSDPRPAGGPEVRRLVVFFATVYFVQSFIEPRTGIAGRSIFFLLKERLGLDAAGTAAFFAIVGIAFAAQPLYGLLSDLVPLRGSRRRAYLLLASGIASVGWLGLARFNGLGYAGTLAPLALAAFGIAFTDVACDAVMVERTAAINLVTMLAFLATLDLAARAVPARAEATFFAALMSVDAVAGSASAWLGGAPYGAVGLIGLVAIGAATRAACWLLVPWLSAAEKARATPA